MTKSKKVKASKTARAMIHLFMHRTQSGNVVSTLLSIPRPGEVTGFEAFWERSPITADLNEQELWLAGMAKTVSAIGGRRLTLRFADEQGRAIMFPATTETAT
jgi:hypothetical protein